MTTWHRYIAWNPYSLHLIHVSILFQNSLQDSLQTFHEVSHNFYLEKTDFILFLNKHDLFVEKLKLTHFQTCMKDYTGKIQMVLLFTVFSTTKIHVKISRKCYNHEAQPSLGTKRTDEEQIMAKQTPHMKNITKTRLFKYIENFTTKNWKFLDKNTDIFQHIYCGYSLEPPRWGGSNEYPQSMFWAEIRKNNVDPCKPQFYYIKVGFNGGQNYISMFSWWTDAQTKKNCNQGIALKRSVGKLLRQVVGA